MTSPSLSPAPSTPLLPQRRHVMGGGGTWLWRGLLCLALLLAAMGTLHARSFSAYQVGFEPREVFPEADRFDPLPGAPKALAAYRGEERVGLVVVNTDAVNAIGYSGKPIRIAFGVTPAGVVTGAKLLEHHEPILLVGIPERKFLDFITNHAGINVHDTLAAGDSGVDAISGATVTAIVARESLLRAAVKALRGHDPNASAAPVPSVIRTFTPPPFERRDWTDLLGSGLVRRLHLLEGEVDAAFDALGVTEAGFEESAPPEETFIDLYAALVTPEVVGRNLLGEAEYANLMARLAPGQQAIALMANGRYSFRGSGFVRGGIFDRFQLRQGEASALFRDKHYTRLGTLAPPDAPAFTEIALFAIPGTLAFQPAEPWSIELLVGRFTGPIDKKFTRFNLTWQPPPAFVTSVAVTAPAAQAAAEEATPGEAMAAGEGEGQALWQRIWRARLGDVAVLAVALGLLTLAFFFQEWLVQRPRLFRWFKYGFLLFTTLWLGLYAQAQLSVVNVLTFLNALREGFSWEFFLLEPLIFVLWVAVAVSLLFWGRGAYCGWLCPFGALQELTYKLAGRLGLRQFRLPFRWHERLWAFKYILFLGLLGVSFHAMSTAEHLAEVEPFKTVVLLRFARSWPFVLYALLLLIGGLFVYRLFCRYLCPLGGALAIPARMRMFEWLKRRKQCGSECQLCARACDIQAIHPEGGINPNECFHCLDCQVIYWDKALCPPLRKGEERRQRRIAIKAQLARKGVITGPEADDALREAQQQQRDQSGAPQQSAAGPTEQP